jgi:hypothetical protein
VSHRYSADNSTNDSTAKSIIRSIVDFTESSTKKDSFNLIDSNYSIDEHLSEELNEKSDEKSDKKDFSTNNIDLLLNPEAAYTHSQEELFTQDFYSNNTSISYEKLFADDPEYMGSNSNLSEMTYSDTDSETLTDEEAEETMEDLQYASMLGTFDSVDFVKRRKLAMWADLNPVERELYHKLNSLTCNVDYSRTF